MKAFREYTDKELLTITSEELTDAIRIEAIEQGISIPITLGEALRKSEWVGYQSPLEKVEVWEVTKPGYFNTGSGIAYLTKEQAERSLEGMIFVTQDYATKSWKLETGEPVVTCRATGVNPAQQRLEKFNEFTQDTCEFDKVVDMCMDRVSAARQLAYDTSVNEQKRAEYMRLADNNEEVAKRFWNKIETGEWPSKKTEA